MNKRIRMMVFGAVATIAVSTVGAATAEAGDRGGHRRGGSSYGRSYGYSRSYSSYNSCGPRYVAARPYYAAPRYYAPVRSSWNNCGPRYAPVRQSFGFSFGYNRGGWGRSGGCR